MKREFLQQMRAKGKLPRIVSEASERCDAAYGPKTRERIFPGPGGLDTVLTNMISTSEQRIDQAQERPAPVGSTYIPPEFKVSDPAIARAHHQAIKAQMVAMGQAVHEERQARIQAQDLLLRATADAGRVA